MRARLAALVALAGIALALAARTAAEEAPEPARDRAADAARALVAVRDADPLELARVAARAGDDAVLALLAPEQSVETRLAAVRASPFLREPERALRALAELVAARDSELAPAAARAALRIARALDGDALARRETAPSELTPALAALLRAAALPRVRANLRHMAAAAAEQLRAAFVPEPAAK